MNKLVKPWDEPLPNEDIFRFKSLLDIQVVFDVGARCNLEYYHLRPWAKHHLFEVNPIFSRWLKHEARGKKNIIVNEYGLGDVKGNFKYHVGYQSISGGEYWNGDGVDVKVKTLDWYVKEYKIKRIDFLKIDTEGYDYKVLLGALKSLPIIKYIQYEHWDDLQEFHDLLEKDYVMEYVGGRNVLCTRRKL